MNEAMTPTVIQDIGALFVTFSPPIIAHALKSYRAMGSQNYYYPDSVYQQLGYIIDGNRAYRPKPTFPDRFR